MRVGLIDSANLCMKMWYGIGRGQVPDYRLAATSVCNSVSKFVKYGMLDGVIWVKEGTPVRRIEESSGAYKANREGAREAQRERDIERTGSSREPTPDFFGLVWDLIAAHSVFSVVHREHEADDTISFLSNHFLEKGHNVIILSKDTDFLQLPQEVDIWKNPILSPDRIMTPPKGILRGEQYLNYKSLLGDPSDNIPGVKGIGKKTATNAVLGNFQEFIDNLPEEKRNQFYNAKSMIKFEEVNPPVELLLSDLPDWKATKEMFKSIGSTIGTDYQKWASWQNSWSKTIKAHEEIVKMLEEIMESK